MSVTIFNAHQYSNQFLKLTKTYLNNASFKISLQYNLFPFRNCRKKQIYSQEINQFVNDISDTTDQNSQQIKNIDLNKLDNFSVFEFYRIIQQWNIKIFLKPRFIDQLSSIQLQKQCSIPLLTQISHISFKNLQSLILNGLGIQSIEPLTWMNIPSINLINLNDNKIVKLKSLSKCSFQGIESLLLGNNIFLNDSLTYMTRLHINDHSIVKNRSFRVMESLDVLRDDQNVIAKGQEGCFINDLLKIQIRKIKKLPIHKLPKLVSQKISKKLWVRFNTKN